MKIKISYKSEEEKEAAASVAALLRQRLPGSRMKETAPKDQHAHIYLTTRRHTSEGAKP